MAHAPSTLFIANRIRLVKRLARRWFSFAKRKVLGLEARPLIVGLLAVVVIIGAAPHRALAAACTSSGTDVVLTVSCEFAAGTYNFSGTLTINPGVTVTAQSSGGSGVIINSDNIRIDGILTANGQGYTTGTGTGPGASCAGGAHGGNGGNNSTGAFLGGTAYGSVTVPDTLGSGGGNCVGGLGGTTGGGAIKLVASGGTVIVAGMLSANGNTSSSASGGGAAGGSIWIDAATITGGGTISANGGNSNSTASGSGAGGRIALYYTTDSSTGTVQAYGGTNATTAENGGSGTIYRKQAAAPNGDLIVDNNNTSTNVAYTQQVTTASQTYDNITIRRGAEYLIPTGYTLNVAGGGAFTGGGTAQPVLVINGTFGAPAAATTFNGINVTHNGAVGVAVDPTIVNGVYTLNTATALFTAGAGNRADDVIVGSGGYLITEGLPLFHVNTLTVNSGGTVTHATNTTATTATGKLHHFDVSATTSIVVNTGGTITANDRGFQAEQGPGKGTDANVGGGGAHGGDGGAGNPSVSGGAGGVAYDSVTRPVELGSGGGDVTGTSADPTGHGGGAIKLSVNAGGTITIDGTVSANGRDVPTTGTDGAGGAGGAIWINGVGSTVNGTGTVVASGGAPSSTNAGSGGGGMIAVYYAGTAPTFSLQARGSNVRGYEKGGAGTIYMKSDAQTFGDLTLDNNNVVGASSSQSAAWPQVYDSISIKGGANYRVSAGMNLSYATSTGSISGGGGTVAGTLTVDGLFVFQSSSFTFSALNLVHYGDVRTLTTASFTNATYAPYPEGAVFSSGTAGRVQDMTFNSGGIYEQRGLGIFYINTLTANSGALITHATNSGATRSYIVDISATSTVTVASGASVDVSKKGYGSSSGSGAAGSSTTGAGYGGNGGAGFSGTPGSTYGSVTQPTDLGSGANGSAASGGGATKIVTAGTLAHSGAISANGGSQATSTGGAAGGSIWLEANVLSGSGTVTANGGNSATNCTCGGGGGGRIALYYTTDSSTFTKQAQGGAKNSSGVVGGAGTIYSKSAAQTNGSLVVDNGSQTASANTTQVAATSLSFDAITVKNGAYYVVPSGATLTLASGSSVLGGGSVMPSLTIQSGGTFNGRSTMTVDGLNVLHTGAFAVTTDLTIKNATFTSSNTNFTAGLAALTVDSGGSYVSSSSTTSLTVSGTITVRSGGLMTSATNTSAHHNSLNISASSLDIQAGGSVSVAGKGFASSEGYAQGTDNATAGGGGGHAGAGGASSSGAAGGSATYGSSTEPVDIGSAGGTDTTSTTVAEGGPGGGAIKIVLSDTLTLNGTLSANGANGLGTTDLGGGGSGGSIWYNVAHAVLNANVTANGGNGAGTTANGGGGGGGGRVAGYFITLTGSGTSTSTGGAKGGTGAAVAGSAGTVFGYNNPPTATITSPNGGENLTGGASSSILFTTVGTADHYRISLSTDSGSTFPTVVANSVSGSPYAWTVNNVTTSAARIKIEAMDSGNNVLSSDVSNADFSIAEAVASGGSGANPSPAIMVGQPNGGETIQGGSSYNVFWTSQGTQISSIRLSYSLDGGSTYAIITSSGNSSSGYYAWAVPDTSSTNAFLKAEGLGAGGSVLVSDTSNDPFTIVGTPLPPETPPEPPSEVSEEPTPPVEEPIETPPEAEAPPTEPEEPRPTPVEETTETVSEPPAETRPRPLPTRPSAPSDGEAPPSTGSGSVVDTTAGETGAPAEPQGETTLPAPTESEPSLPALEWLVRDEGHLDETPLLDVLARATDRIPVVREAVQASREAVKALRTNETVQTTNTVVLTPAVTGAAAVATTSAVGLTGFASYAMFLVTQPLALLDRRRRKAYGTVYNVGTKLPVDLAIVRLLDATGQKAIATRVTDHLGRYMFLTVPGTYRLEVQKQGFEFPPVRTISGVADGPYADLHVGGEVVAAEGVVAKNIPLEPKEENRPNAKVIASAARYKLQWAFTAFGPGFAVASYVVTPRWEQVAALTVQIGLTLIFSRIAKKRKPKSWGVVRDALGAPVQRAVVRVVEDAYNKVLEAQVTDRAGRYAFLVGQNRYFVTAEHAAHQGARTETFDFSRSKDPAFIAKDIQLRGANIEPKPTP
ncbi:MAG: hypothetical protein QY323_02175 [Patescibacteria group bacterium]|nr:MAG: hypothetical protein QY323_02175 [Patescibacteria group bacterium]